MNDPAAEKAGRPIAFVSGASGGIGTAICRHLVVDGYRVVATARKLESLQSLQQELGEHLYPMALDVTDAICVRELVGSLPADFKEVAVLVNNAGPSNGVTSSTPTSRA